MGSLTLITGPVRSGKSQLAVERARNWDENAVFVATYQRDPADAEMAERVRRHRTSRPAWRTLEAPADVAGSLSTLSPAPSGVLIDCLTLWASARFADSDETLKTRWNTQLAAFTAAPWPVIVVSNELGWGLVPAEADARRFRDLAGTLAQLTTAAAQEVWLVVAGCPLRLK
jgi:adenosylcobinamide kinase/adenosylcobinamide-phosphate guanylyltransferase